MSAILRFITNKRFIVCFWFGLSLFAALKAAFMGRYNNYLIFKYSFINLLHENNLYSQQPEHYFDSNHYGPVFGLIIAPFTYLPDGVSVVLWVMLNAFILYRAVMLLPLNEKQRFAVLLISAHELMTSSYGEQFNPMLTGLILFSFILIRRKQDFWAALMICIGTFVKLYGIVGLAFFFFSDNKLKFILGLVFWSLVLFVLPMPFSSPAFVVQSYHDWYMSLTEKNSLNMVSTMQDICVMGMMRRIFNYQLSDLYVLIPAVLVFASSYLRISQFRNTQFQLLILASTLVFTVIFSTGSESPTYIIAFIGVAVWYMNLDRPVTNVEIFLLVFALLITSLSPSDLFPKYINKHYIKPYALKALPCFIIWLKIIYETWTRKFNQQTNYQVSSV
jgi:hypothetical protein